MGHTLFVQSHTMSHVTLFSFLIHSVFSCKNKAFIMKKLKLYLSTVLVFCSTLLSAQLTMSITNPTLTSPYQVTTGTMVTFKWSASSIAPTGIFTSTTAPTINQGLMPSSSWAWLSNWTGPDANGDYSINITVNSDIWVFGGLNWIYWISILKRSCRSSHFSNGYYCQ